MKDCSHYQDRIGDYVDQMREGTLEVEKLEAHVRECEFECREYFLRIVKAKLLNAGRRNPLDQRAMDLLACVNGAAEEYAGFPGPKMPILRLARIIRRQLRKIVPRRHIYPY